MSDINISALSTSTVSAIGLGNLILVTPEDKGISPELVNTQTQKRFLFDFYGEQSIDLDCEITDHYVEDNTALQDHIAIKPEMIVGEGYIGELKDFIPDLPSALKSIPQKLVALSAYAPALTTTALIAYNTAFQVYQIGKAGTADLVSRWNSLNGQTETQIGSASFDKVQNEQQKAFQMFYGYRQERILFTVQTPWAIFQHCALKRLHAVQDATTRMISSFEVTFKPIKFAKTQITDQNGNLIIGGEIINAQVAAGSPTNLGTSPGNPVTDTISTLFTAVTP